MSKQFDILIIDDEQVVVDAVIKICSAEGYQVDSAIDAAQGLKKLGSDTYRIILCDIMMPEMDGFQLLDEIIKRNIESPLIMTTGFSTVENAVKSLYNGAIDFVPKPFTSDELLSSIIRGLRYSDIQIKIKYTGVRPDDASIFYVPCPAKYFRLGYSSWACQDQSGSVLIGVTDLFLRTIAALDEIELHKTDEEVIQGNSCAQIKSKREIVHSLLSPVSGRIIETNERVLNEISIIEKDPYFEGWLYRVIPSDIEYELKQLIPCSSDRL